MDSGNRSRTTPRRRLIAVVAVLCATLGALAIAAAGAPAKTIYTHPFVTSFNGAGSMGAGGSTGPLSAVGDIAFDGNAGTLYALDRGYEEGVLDKFDALGAPQAFSAQPPGTTSLHPGCSYGGSTIAVDNSGTATEGRIYVLTDCAVVHAYEPNGTELGGNFPLTDPTFSFPCGVGVDPDGKLWVNDFHIGMTQFDPSGVATGQHFAPGLSCHFAIDQSAAPSPTRGDFWIIHTGDGGINVDQYVNPQGDKGLSLIPDENVPRSVAVDKNTSHIYVNDGSHFSEFDPGGNQLGTSGRPSIGHGFPSGPCPESAGIAVDAATERIYVADCNQINVFGPGVNEIFPTVVTDPADTVASGATLRGHVDPDGGGDTNDCHFEWGREVGQGGNTITYEHSIPCLPNAAIHNSDGNTAVSATLDHLDEGSEYHSRLVSSNDNGPEFGVDRKFIARQAPTISEVLVSKVNTDGATLSATIDPRGAATTFHIEWGTDTGYGNVIPVPDGIVSAPSAKVPDPIHPHNQSVNLTGLTPGATYHFRFVATNVLETVYSGDLSFTTFNISDETTDSCGNAPQRKQTGTALLFDCRAYELVSAGNTGGYDVQSDLVPGQATLPAHPNARDKVLYSMHDGAIPGIAGNPTNLGLDPYVATRGDGGWSTAYLGVPADNPFSDRPFSSVPSGADDSLATFAFGDAGGCSPCFADGSTGIPVRLPNGSLVQGMVAAPGVPEPGPGAEQDGYVAKKVSANGAHLVFGSTSRFAPGGNDGTGDVSIYDRNLLTGETHVVSNDPAGNPLPCLQGAGSCHSPGDGNGIGALDLSADGSRVLIGQKASTDAAGNALWRLYMTIGDAGNSIAIAPGATSGVLYDGMTADGSKVFMTATDKLLPEDIDSSADIYEADVDGGAVSLSLLSDGAGVTGNTDSCNPVGDWNLASGGPDCSAVALAGGTGVASGDGTVYFFSPELLDGPSNGDQDEPNLFVAKPGAPPRFVATIDSSVSKPPPPPPSHPLVNAAFGPEFGNAEGVAIDRLTRDVYAIERQDGSVVRLDASGAPHNFSAGPNAGGNALTGFGFDGPSASEVAVDRSGGALDGSVYVASFAGISIFGSDGGVLGSLNGSGTNAGSFGEACGVAVDQTTGDVYVADYYGKVWRYSPSSPSVPLSDGDYTVTGISTNGLNPCNLAVDSIGHLYASGWADGPLNEYDTSAFTAGPPPVPQLKPVAVTSTAVAVDPQTNLVYVDQANKVAIFDSAGNPVSTFGAKNMSGSRGVAVDPTNGHVIVSSGGTKLVEFGVQPTPYKPIDNPAVVHGVNSSAVHGFGDFQVSPDGEFAAFASAESLTGFANRGHYEVYRYATAGSGRLDCASCAPTGAGADSDVTLSANGLNLTNDGRVFFTTSEKLVVRDTNSVKDAYEWENGANELISAGSSQFDSGLVTASADGTDVFFFTRQVLVPQDGNGAVLKIYDARTNGGFFVGQQSVPCQASDECHGPGTEAAPPPAIGTYKGVGGNAKPSHRRKKRHKKHHKRTRRHHKGKGGRHHG
jgi:hypothetical protein